MKKILLFIAFCFGYFGAMSAVIPSSSFTPTSPGNSINPLHHFATLSIKEVQKLAGRKLTLKEKIAVKIFQWKIKKNIAAKKNDDKKDKGKTALLLGTAALVCLLLMTVLPMIFWVAVALAVAAILTGRSALKENPESKKARTGQLLGWITLALFLIVLVIALIALSSWSFGWG